MLKILNIIYIKLDKIKKVSIQKISGNINT